MRRASFVLLLALAGCSGVVGSIKSAFEQRPTAIVREVRLSGFDLESVTLEFRVEVTNPYAVALPLVGLDYGFSTNGQLFLDGTTDLEERIGAGDVQIVPMPVRVDIPELLRTFAGLRPGQVIPYDAALTLRVDVPEVGAVALPMSRSGQLPVPAPPSVTVASIDWDGVSLSEVTGTLTLEVANPNDFSFTLRKFDYDLGLAGRSVARGEGERSIWLSAGHDGQIPVPISFSPGDAGAAFVSLLSHNRIDYSLAGDLEIETPYGVISTPFGSSGQAIQTR